jgi:hypothetical protein
MQWYVLLVYIKSMLDQLTGPSQHIKMTHSMVPGRKMNRSIRRIIALHTLPMLIFFGSFFLADSAAGEYFPTRAMQLFGKVVNQAHLIRCRKMYGWYVKPQDLCPPLLLWRLPEAYAPPGGCVQLESAGYPDHE